MLSLVLTARPHADGQTWLCVCPGAQQAPEAAVSHAAECRRCLLRQLSLLRGGGDTAAQLRLDALRLQLCGSTETSVAASRRTRQIPVRR